MTGGKENPVLPQAVNNAAKHAEGVRIPIKPCQVICEQPLYTIDIKNPGKSLAGRRQPTLKLEIIHDTTLEFLRESVRIIESVRHR